MTATSAVSPGRSASSGSSGSQRNPVVSRAPVTGPFSPEVTWAAAASAVSAIAGGTPGFPGAWHAHRGQDRCAGGCYGGPS